MINVSILLAAAEGHIEAVGKTSEEIRLRLERDDVDPDAFRDVASTLLDQRFSELPGSISARAGYAGGIIDGFMLGVNAARFERADVRVQRLQELVSDAASEASLCDSPEKLEALVQKLLDIAGDPC